MTAAEVDPFPSEPTLFGRGREMSFGKPAFPNLLGLSLARRIMILQKNGSKRIFSM